MTSATISPSRSASTLAEAATHLQRAQAWRSEGHTQQLDSDWRLANTGYTERANCTHWRMLSPTAGSTCLKSASAGERPINGASTPVSEATTMLAL